MLITQGSEVTLFHWMLIKLQVLLDFSNVETGPSVKVKASNLKTGFVRSFFACMVS